MKHDLTKFVGKVHSITYRMNGIQIQSRIKIKLFMQRLRKDVTGKGGAAIESQSSEKNPLLSKLLLIEDPR